MAEQKKSPQAQDEHEILKYWEKHEVFEKSVENRPKERSYVFYDGPPFATGLPHYGHIVASVMKDVAPRFWTMRGRRVERVWGWDCHGLPIENIIEKEKNLKSRADIEAFGIEKFNEACHDTVLTYVAEWKKTIRRIGRWVDMEHSYKTMDLSYMESIWWVFKSLWDKGLIYEGYKPMHICPRCETALSNFEVGQNYADVKDLSVYVTFPLLSGPHQGASLVAWTTTPWTLPGNVLLAVGEKLDYVKVKIEGKEYIFGQEAWERLEKEFVSPTSPGPSLAKRGDAGEIPPLTKGRLGGVLPVKVSDLLGSTYEPLFPFFADHENAFRVVAGGFVTTEEGTGVVHIAPGFGEDDMELGKQEGVAPIVHVRMNGHFVPEVADPLAAEGFDVKDKPIKAKNDTQTVDVEILRALAKHDRLLWKKKVEHSYPLCWRCDTPLLNYATSSWFVRVTELKDRLLELNRGINWVPDTMKEGRFGSWLEGARDWAVSRSRFWGTPLPIWRAQDGETLCVGSIAELEKLSGKKIKDLHKHVIDKVEIKKGKKVFHRVPEVLDCWFESGSMPYAQIHYPFENKEVFEKGFPAEFIAEGQDQTRGWFYTLHVLATALFDSPAFKNVVVNGIVLAEDGRKMSKRLKNYPDPNELVEKYGADAMRYYLMASPVVHAENLRFSESGVDEVAKKFVLILRNVLSFYRLYAESEPPVVPLRKGDASVNSPPFEGGVRGGSDLSIGGRFMATHVLDRWILARLSETLKEETDALEAYDFSGAARALQPFVTDLSTWYVRRSRERLKPLAGNPLTSPLGRGTSESESPPARGGARGGGRFDDALECLATLRTVLDEFGKMLAPFMPFLAEKVYQEVQGSFSGKDKRLSVHLEDWSEVKAEWLDQEILEDMGRVRSIVSRALEARSQAGINVRQPLACMTVNLPEGPSTSPRISPEPVEGDIGASLRDYVKIIQEEVNVKQIVFRRGKEYVVELDTKLTPELVREGTIREIIRRVNAMRKDAGLTIADRIELYVTSEDKEVQKALGEFRDELVSGTLASGLRTQGEAPKRHETFRVNEFGVTVGF